MTQLPSATPNSFARASLKLSLMLIPLLAACGGTLETLGDEDGVEEQHLGPCSALGVASASSSSSLSGHPAQNAFDGTRTTRWAAQGLGEWLTADLGAVKKVCAVNLAWYLGGSRSYSFTVGLSTDGVAFNPVFSGNSGGKSAGLKTYDFPDGEARYVRVTVNGNSVNDVAGITELAVRGDALAPAPVPLTTTAAFSFTPAAPAAGSAVSFDASASTCASSPCTFTWTDEPPGGAIFPLGTGQTMSFTFQNPGTKYVTLVVADALGGSARVEHDVVVGEVAPPPPPAAVCADGQDNDGDGKVDFPADPGCSSATDTDETDEVAPSTTCNLNATPSNFASVFSSAQAGQTLCLASGSYGTFGCGSKSGTVTIKPAAGASATMALDCSSASNLRFDGLTISSLNFGRSVRNVTVANSRFTGFAYIDATGMQNAGILFDGNTHVDINMPSTAQPPGRVHVDAGNVNPGTPSGIVVRNSLFSGGTADGIRADGGVSMVIEGNEFTGIRDVDPYHADAIQFYGGSRVTIRGNYFHDLAEAASCSLGQHDGGDHHLIEDNVVVGGNCYFAMYLLADDSSIVRHNTFVFGACLSGMQCGQIAIGGKDEAGRGTLFQDNIFTSFSNGMGGMTATYTADHNLTRSAVAGTGNIVGVPVFVGGTGMAAYKLATGSPGKGAASDGLDIGARIGTSTPPASAACGDGQDNDGDGRVDFPADPGCASATDTDETDPVSPPADTTAPNLAISSPAAGATVNGTVNVSGTASDDATLSRVEVRVDSGAYVAATGSSSWSFSWNTSAVANGSHTLTARAVDAAGNTRTATVTVTVSNSSPSSSGFPDASNTGVPAGTTLTRYTGPCSWRDGTTVTLDRVDALACGALVTYGPALRITNSLVPRIEAAGGSVDISDSSVQAGDWVEGALWGSNITATRVNVTGGQHSFHCEGNCTLTDSYLHDQYNPAGGSTHNNAFLTNGGRNMVVRHNTLHCTPRLNSTGGGCTGDAVLLGDFDTLSYITVENNLLKANDSSISYCAYGGYAPSKAFPIPDHITFTGNVFERGANGKCGVYGAITSWYFDSTNVWSNNRWDDGTILNAE